MSSQARPTLHLVLICVALFVGTLAVFSRSVPFGFINYDDPAIVVNNPYVQRGLTWEGVRWAFAVDRDYWHPLTWISLMADRTWLGPDARGFRAENIVWHALNALLVFALIRRMTGTLWGAAACAAVFAWHPLRVESVTWVTQRKDVLSGFFVLVSFWAYLGYGAAVRDGLGRLRVAVGYVLALAMFACALLSKSVVVVVPLVLLLLDVWPLRRWAAMATAGRPWPLVACRLVGEKLPFFLLSLAVGLFTVSTQEAAGAFSLPLSFDQRAANAVVAVVRYLGTSVWPFGLSVMYPHPGDWPVLIVGAAGVVVAVITAVAIWSARERPWLLVGWGWFLAFLLPTLGLLQVGLQAMADRYTYLPAIGLSLVLAQAVGPVVSGLDLRLRRAGVALVGLILAGLAVRTWDQQGVWRDADALFNQALAVTRDNYVAHSALALQRLGDNRVEEAARHAEAALAIAPESPLVLDTVGSVRLAQGRVDEAIQAYRAVIARQPNAVSAKCDLGQVLLAQNRIDEAETLFDEARRTRPVSVPAHLGLADVAVARGRLDEALRWLTRAQELAPRDVRTILRVAALQFQLGRRDEAAATLGLAAALEPDNPELQRDVGDALGQLGRFEAAAAAYGRVVALVPGDAAAHARLGYVQFLLNRPEEAIRSWETALRLDPGMSELHQRIQRARSRLPAGER